MKITVKQLADELQSEAESLADKPSSAYIATWAGAYAHASEICCQNRGNRVRTRKALLRVARSISGDPVSTVYISAARRLGSRAKF